MFFSARFALAGNIIEEKRARHVPSPAGGAAVPRAEGDRANIGDGMSRAFTILHGERIAADQKAKILRKYHTNFAESTAS